MAQRRSNTRISSAPDTAVLSRRKLHPRRATSARRRVFTLSNSYAQPSSSSHASVASSSTPPSSPRPVLVPLQFNLRRLPSRLYSDRKESMRDAPDGFHVRVGSKRKHVVVSGSENSSATRTSRTANRVKRLRAARDSSEDGTASAMDIDDQDRWDLSDNSEDEDAMDSCKWILSSQFNFCLTHCSR